MEEQVGIVNGIHTTVRKYRADMFMEFLADTEGVMELLHESCFLGSDLK